MPSLKDPTVPNFPLSVFFSATATSEVSSQRQLLSSTVSSSCDWAQRQLKVISQFC